MTNMADSLSAMLASAASTRSGSILRPSVTVCSCHVSEASKASNEGCAGEMAAAKVASNGARGVSQLVPFARTIFNTSGHNGSGLACIRFSACFLNGA
jgi:hypothetical protein